MRVSAKAEYACLAVLELALHQARAEPLRASNIAEANAIPQQFLVQILLQLKGVGWVSSTRGAAGGYRLTVDPASLTLWDVIQAIEGPAVSEVEESKRPKTLGWRVLRHAFRKVARSEQQLLQETTFAELAQQAEPSLSDMYHI